jgi:hypothetical protein
VPSLEIRGQKMTLRSAAKSLLILAVALPICEAVLVWVAALLKAMGDAQGAIVIGYVSTICQIVWSITLVGLVITSAAITLNEPPKQE